MLDPRDARVPQRGELDGLVDAGEHLLVAFAPHEQWDRDVECGQYSALVTDDPNQALLISVNHGGDSDSTASMCGNLVGALHGVDQIRQDRVECVQFRDVIDRMIADWVAGDWSGRADGTGVVHPIPALLG